MDCSPPGSSVLCPWDFPGKNTGMGCHFLLQGIFPTQGLNSHLLHCRQILYHPSHQGSPTKCCQSLSHVRLCCNPMDCKPARLLCPWDFPVKNTGVGCHFCLQGIFLTQRLNPSLPHRQVDSLPLSHKGHLFSGLACNLRQKASQTKHKTLLCSIQPRQDKRIHQSAHTVPKKALAGTSSPIFKVLKMVLGALKVIA